MAGIFVRTSNAPLDRGKFPRYVVNERDRADRIAARAHRPMTYSRFMTSMSSFSAYLSFPPRPRP